MLTTWTPERVEAVRGFLANGMSTAQIAAELGGITRNAVIGIVHRHGLSGLRPGRPPSLARARRKHRERNGRSRSQAASERQVRNRLAQAPDLKATELTEMPETVAALRPAKLTRLADLESSMCRFPYTWTADDPSPDGLSTGYCGSMVAEHGCSYCARHHRLVYR